MPAFPQRVIVLGSSGFIGKRLCAEFSARRNFELKGLSSNDCNLLSGSDVEKCLSDITQDDVLIMTSAITRLKENTFDSMLKNIKMAGNVARIIKRHPVGYMIYLSTVDVYGIYINGDIKITEKLALDPNDDYAISKMVGEFLLKKECSNKKIPLGIFRLSGVYGPGDNGKSTVGILVRSAFKKGEVCIHGKGLNMRDYVYVDDIGKILQESIEKKLSGTINVATGKSHSIVEIVGLLKSLSPLPFRVEFVEPAKPREKRIENMIFDCSLLMQEFPNLKMVDIEDGLSYYISDFLKD